MLKYFRVVSWKTVVNTRNIVEKMCQHHCQTVYNNGSRWCDFFWNPRHLFSHVHTFTCWGAHTYNLENKINLKLLVQLLLYTFVFVSSSSTFTKYLTKTSQAQNLFMFWLTVLEGPSQVWWQKAGRAALRMPVSGWGKANHAQVDETAETTAEAGDRVQPSSLSILCSITSEWFQLPQPKL